MDWAASIPPLSAIIYSERFTAMMSPTVPSAEACSMGIRGLPKMLA